MAEKNGHRSWSMLFRLERAQLASAALDFGRARELCAGVLAEAGESPEPTGQILFHGRIALAQALVGLARCREAQLELAEVERSLAQAGSLMDWMLYLPLRACAAECRLALGDLAGARAAAEDLAERAGQCGEGTYRALALELSGRIAERAGERAAAKGALARASEATGERDLPLARLSVLRAALVLGEERELREREMQALVRRLADQLGADPALRERFEARALVKRTPCAPSVAEPRAMLRPRADDGVPPGRALPRR
jgi:hypothetical protein